MNYDGHVENDFFLAIVEDFRQLFVNITNNISIAKVEGGNGNLTLISESYSSGIEQCEHDTSA